MATISAGGGLGGYNANSVGTGSGGTGQSSDFGAGGAGGSRNNHGSDATSTHWGAGGGGGGGDASGFLDSSGNAGGGGERGEVVTQTIDLSSETQNTFIVVSSFGAGGVQSSGTYTGGDGAQGAMTYTSVLGGTTQYTLSNIVPSLATTATGSYVQAGSGGTVDHFTALFACKTNDFPLVTYEGATVSYIDGDRNVTVYKIRAKYKVM